MLGCSTYHATVMQDITVVQPINNSGSKGILLTLGAL